MPDFKITHSRMIDGVWVGDYGRFLFFPSSLFSLFTERRRKKSVSSRYGIWSLSGLPTAGLSVQRFDDAWFTFFVWFFFLKRAPL